MQSRAPSSTHDTILALAEDLGLAPQLCYTLASTTRFPAAAAIAPPAEGPAFAVSPTHGAASAATQEAAQAGEATPMAVSESVQAAKPPQPTRRKRKHSQPRATAVHSHSTKKSDAQKQAEAQRRQNTILARRGRARRKAAETALEVHTTRLRTQVEQAMQQYNQARTTRGLAEEPTPVNQTALLCAQAMIPLDTRAATNNAHAKQYRDGLTPQQRDTADYSAFTKKTVKISRERRKVRKTHWALEVSELENTLGTIQEKHRALKKQPIPSGASRSIQSQRARLFQPPMPAETQLDRTVTRSHRQ